MKQTLVVAAILLASLAPAASAATVASATWGTAAAPIEAAPGDTARLLTVTILNTDSDSFVSARAVLSGAGGITPAAGGGTATLAGVFAPGGVWTASFLVNVAPDAASTADLPLRITMQYASSTETISRNLVVPVQLTGRPMLSLTATDDTLPSWSRVGLPVRVANEGSGAAGSVSVRAAPATGSTISMGDDGVRSLGGVAAGAARVADLSVVTAAPGASALVLTLSYANAAGATVTETRTLTVRVVDEAPTPLRARLVESALEPGSPGLASFLIDNAGEGIAHDVSVHLALPPSASVLDGTDDQFLGDIAAGQGRAAVFAIRPASSASDLLDVTLTLTWKDDDGVVHTATRRDALPLAQASAGTLRIGLGSPSLEAGSAGALVFDVTNDEATPLRDVRVTFTLPSGVATAFTPVNATDSQRLGELAPGETRQATLRLLTSQAAKDIYPFAATASWVGADGIVRSETYRFGVIVRGTVDLVVTDGTATLEEADSVLTIAGTITNLGNVKAHNAYLRVLATPQLEESEAQFLGDLDPNSALPFSIDVDTLGAVAASAPIHLTWNDEYGVIHEARFDTPLREVEAASDDDSESDSGGNRSPGPALALVVLAIAALALVVRRKR